MDLMSAAEILTFSRPFLDPLLDGSKDRLKELGKGLTGRTLDALHAFWQRLTRERPETAVLARREGADDNLKRLIAEALAADPILKQLAEDLRPEIRVSGHQGARIVTAGDGGQAVGGDVHGNLTINNRPR